MKLRFKIPNLIIVKCMLVYWQIINWKRKIKLIIWVANWLTTRQVKLERWAVHISNDIDSRTTLIGEVSQLSLNIEYSNSDYRYRDH